MNLTSMLVLTTMFINVSNSLPKTSYMKMVDAWLLFNLLYPFIVVLIHTYMDTLRNDDDRDINHHGKTITIGEAELEERAFSGKYTYLLDIFVQLHFLVQLVYNFPIFIFRSASSSRNRSSEEKKNTEEKVLE